MNFGAIIGVYWRFDKVISTVLILNIIQVEEIFSATYNTIFEIDIDGVNCFKS